jgi:DNA-binding IclR family transcriptional regulator
MEYYEGNVLSHTIPKIAREPSEKILRLLRTTKILSCEDIVKKTGLNISEVINVLEELERAGLVQRYS